MDQQQLDPRSTEPVASSSSTPSTEQVVPKRSEALVCPFYKIGRKIGSGTFGELRLGKHVSTKNLVAIKVELKNAKVPQLMTEYSNYLILGEMLGIPKIYFYTEVSNRRLLIMELLGCNLEELFNLCGRYFSLKTVCKLALQMIDRLKFVHSKGLIYRDIKPENFLMGKYQSPRQNIVHLVDFGLAKQYVDSEGQHIPFVNNRCLTGTARYMSLNAHLGMEQSRRDDLISLGFVLVYFMRNRLPWQGIPAEDSKEKCRKIAEVKRATTVEDLCAGLPVEFLKYFYYVYQLDFFDAPDYHFIRNLFSLVLSKMNVYEYDMDFEWNSILATRYQNKRKAKLAEALAEVKPEADLINKEYSKPTTTEPQLLAQTTEILLPDQMRFDSGKAIGTPNINLPHKNVQQIMTVSPSPKAVTSQVDTSNVHEEWDEKAILEGHYIPTQIERDDRNFSTENIHGQQH